MRNLLIPISALGLISLVLSGCASTKEAVLPQDGPPMKAIYEQHIQQMGASDPLTMREALGNRPVADGAGVIGEYNRF